MIFTFRLQNYKQIYNVPLYDVTQFFLQVTFTI